MSRLFVFILCIVCPSILWAEQIMMKSGEVYDAKIASQTEHHLTIETKAGPKTLRKMDILEVLLLSNTDQLYPTRVLIVELQDRSEKKDATIGKTLGIHLQKKISEIQSDGKARFKVLKTVPFTYQYADVAANELADGAIIGSYTIGTEKIGIVFKAYDTSGQNIRLERAFSIQRSELSDATLQSVTVQFAESLAEVYPERNVLERAKSHEKLLAMRNRPRPLWFASLGAGLLIPTDKLNETKSASPVTSAALARQVYAPVDAYVTGRMLWQTLNRQNIDDNALPLWGGGFGLGANFWYFQKWAAAYSEFNFAVLTGSTKRKNRATAEFLLHQFSFDVGVNFSPFRNTSLRIGMQNNLLIDADNTHYLPGVSVGMGMRW